MKFNTMRAVLGKGSGSSSTTKWGSDTFELEGHGWDRIYFSCRYADGARGYLVVAKDPSNPALAGVGTL